MKKQELYEIFIKKMEEESKMQTIKEEAMAYEPPTTKNISELDKVPVDLEVYEGTGMDSDNKEFKYKYIIVDGQQYKMPNVVLGNLKTIIENNPKTEYFKVYRKGEGLKTRYTVLPVQGDNP